MLGGYGHFGGHICRALAATVGIAVVVAGRNAALASAAARKLGAAHDGVALDFTASDFPQRLLELRVNAVVHTGGPFQTQDYRVAQACINAGVHYIDLADGRAFVTGITALDAAARAHNVLVTSGASAVPALSSAVVDEYRAHFKHLDTIDMSIAPGQQNPRGVATLQGVLSYCGKPFTTWEKGAWQTAYGWQGVKRFYYRELGGRWLARCDVPDLPLFVERYPGVQRVRFDAALELPIAQGTFWFLAALVRLGLIADASRFAAPVLNCARYFDAFGSDTGGMYVGLTGTDRLGGPVRVDWHLTARRGHGPQIPCIAAIVVARKLAAGTLLARGAMPCMGLMTLTEFGQAVAPLDIAWRTAFA